MHLQMCKTCKLEPARKASISDEALFSSMQMNSSTRTRTHTHIELAAVNTFNQPLKKPPKPPHFCNPRFVLLLQ